MTIVYSVKNLDCANCAKKLERAIAKLDEVKAINLVFMTEKLVIESDAENIDELIIKTAKKTMPIVEIERI